MVQSSVIIGTGSYIPTNVVKNSSFLEKTFLKPDGDAIPKEAADIIRKLQDITGINERRYVSDDLVTSDIAHFAAEKALESSRIDKETLDYIIVAHNFGDVRKETGRTDMVPTLASRVKQKLGVSNPYCVAYDLPFGCPGWVQGLIQAHQFMKAGDATRALIIGAETLSRVYDPSDQDSMIYSDGAGAAILERRSGPTAEGILSHVTRTDAVEHANLLQMNNSFDQETSTKELFLKMNGNQVYKYALKTVPKVVQESLHKAGVSLAQIRKVLIHQANEKMDDEIIKRLFNINGNKTLDRETLSELMPITINWLGNSSVATVPTLLDLITRGKLPSHELSAGDLVVIASVGAGMNINSVVYKMTE